MYFLLSLIIIFSFFFSFFFPTVLSFSVWKDTSFVLPSLFVKSLLSLVFRVRESAVFLKDRTLSPLIGGARSLICFGPWRHSSVPACGPLLSPACRNQTSSWLRSSLCLEPIKFLGSNPEVLPVRLLMSVLLWLFRHIVIFINNKRVVCVVGIKGKNLAFQKRKGIISASIWPHNSYKKEKSVFS